jgi:hypothetical protein
LKIVFGTTVIVRGENIDSDHKQDRRKEVSQILKIGLMGKTIDQVDIDYHIVYRYFGKYDRIDNVEWKPVVFIENPLPLTQQIGQANTVYKEGDYGKVFSGIHGDKCKEKSFQDYPETTLIIIMKYRRAST